MKTLSCTIFLVLFTASFQVHSQPARMLPEVTPAGKGRVNTRVDNIGYWSQMVRKGYVRADTATRFIPARYDGTLINMYDQSAVGSRQSAVGSRQSAVGGHPSRVTRHASRIIDSPDIPVTSDPDVTQSENSVFIDPADEGVVLNSNNSSSWVSGYAATAFGADAFHSGDYGMSWEGSAAGVNGVNGGDPSVAIGLNGWWYAGRITADMGQAVSCSKNRGLDWTSVKTGQVPPGVPGILDKNHLWIDNSPSSPYQGYLYDAWTNFISGDPDSSQVQIVSSSDQGLTWSEPVTISVEAQALDMNHGVNLHTGPGGELYAAWSIYDAWPADETAIGFARSFNGGAVFMPATRIIGNIKGIRASMTSKNMRVNSFPSMAVDNSTGPHRGTIYLVWANRGVPGINTGNDIDIYLIRSSDQGTSWSDPVRVNQDPSGSGKQHFFPWIACDPVTGGLCVTYYDDRNADSAGMATFVSVSYDGGNTWNDIQVSDYTFTPAPIPGLTFSYFGDYIGIRTHNMKVYPVWTDNHDGGRTMTWVSPFDLGPNPGQPWITCYSDSLSDVSGTGNATLDFGDSLHLSLGLKNIGDLPAAGVLARISTASPYICITCDTASYGMLEPGTVRVKPDGFTLRVSDTIPDDLPVRFDVLASGADSSWQSHFAIESHAPALHIGGFTVIDTLGGNRNGRMDPGETVTVKVPLSNTGDYPCLSSWCRFSAVSPFLISGTDSLFAGDIPPGENVSLAFPVTVSPDASAGSSVVLSFSAGSGLYRARIVFRTSIGMIVEDWESGTFSRFPWQQDGAKPWTLTDNDPWEGEFAAESGPVGDNTASEVSLFFESASDDSISFHLRTSSEQDYDFLMFFIDGVLQGQWSGETPWMRAAFPVAAGEHRYQWSYRKDLAVASGQDRAWVDFIVFPPPVLPEVDPGAGDTLCGGETALLNATAVRCDSMKWTTSGDGAFGNDTIPATTYTPGSGDRDHGGVTLRLTGYGIYGSASGTKQILILRECAGFTDNDPCRISIYPNPGNGVFRLEVPGCRTEPLHVRVTDLLGQLVFSMEDPRAPGDRKITLNLSFLPEGVYLLSLPARQAPLVLKLFINRRNP